MHRATVAFIVQSLQFLPGAQLLQEQHIYTVFTLTWHGAAQHDTIQHGPRLHTIIIRGVGWAFEQNGGGKTPWRLCLYSVPVGFVFPLF